MISRRSLVTSGFIGATVVGLGTYATASSQSQATPSADAREYQGILAIQSIPPLPVAPTGECAIVLHTSGTRDSVAAVYHNATDQVMAVNAVTAVSTNRYGTESKSVPEESNHGPHILQPGEYGIATPTFGSILNEEDSVVVEIDAVPEAEGDSTVVSLPVSNVVIREEGDSTFIEATVINRSGNTLAPGCGPLTVFFTPDGEILDWLSTISMREFELDGESRFAYGSNGLSVSDSYMMVFGGRILE